MYVVETFCQEDMSATWDPYPTMDAAITGCLSGPGPFHLLAVYNKDYGIRYPTSYPDITEAEGSAMHGRLGLNNDNVFDELSVQDLVPLPTCIKDLCQHLRAGRAVYHNEGACRVLIRCVDDNVYNDVRSREEDYKSLVAPGCWHKGNIFPYVNEL